MELENKCEGADELIQSEGKTQTQGIFTRQCFLHKTVNYEQVFWPFVLTKTEFWGTEN